MRRIGNSPRTGSLVDQELMAQRNNLELQGEALAESRSEQIEESEAERRHEAYRIGLSLSTPCRRHREGASLVDKGFVVWKSTASNIWARQAVGFTSVQYDNALHVCILGRRP